MSTLLSLNVGLPKDVPWQGETVHTGIYKTPVDGARMVRRLNIDGDGQGDLAGHGGEQRAVFVYQQQSYAHWAEFLGRDDLTPGCFGENFTVDGLPDDEVCIGDRYRIGDAEFEVTQPRVTCFRVGLRLAEPRMPALLVGHRRPGFYFRVITEGEVRAGDAIVKTRTGPHALTVTRTDGLLYLPHRSDDDLRKAVDIPALSPGWQQSFHDLLGTDLADATVIGPTIGTRPGWNGFRPMTVSKTVAETAVTTSVYLTADGGPPIDTPLPGQYLTLRVALPDGATAVRSYSISGIPDGTSYRITVKREDHGQISRYIHDQLRVGADLEVAAPRGEFVLRDAADPVLLVSAGVGVTPVISMLRRLAEAGSEREIWWIQAARTPDEQIFAREAGDYLKELPNAHAVTFYTRYTTPIEGSLAGRPTEERLRELGVPTRAAAYVCGPAGFIADVTSALGDLGLDPGSIYSEVFTTLAPIHPGVVAHASVSPHQPTGPPGTGPAVTFARSGLTVRWRSDDSSLLGLAEASDVPTRFSCRAGVCHTCVTPLIAGEVSYDPDPLELPPDGQVLVCCALPTGDIVLDA
ncbi:MOSC and FAD-binding oxidoreductase domain-containing protein [Herbiconiux sp. CPCC 205763]|uniref:MOSC and FAD-binding oxidoreductase domain-containing protein n=1 Tax=Herbiconiux aconitum TaxID=2970913 RepID=A0ABT2GQ99_9MICO|nr:MOSC and FAD-binding oxidoreductase domain-containing protein [Herbiconiux aconitum]MCS5718404.1 MOSC and FAD-binding oxidoreductase domain-containing protein [Herbiconiux aconitum]